MPSPSATRLGTALAFLLLCAATRADTVKIISTPPGATVEIDGRSEEHTSELQSRQYLVCVVLLRRPPRSTLFPYTNALPISLFCFFAPRRAPTPSKSSARLRARPWKLMADRKSTRLNSSHANISYALYCYVDPRDLHSFPTRTLFRSRFSASLRRDARRHRQNHQHASGRDRGN